MARARDTTPDSSPEPRVRVECYAGSRGQETPRAVHLAGRRLRVAEVLDRRRETGPERGGGVRERFVVRLEDGSRLTLVLQMSAGIWEALEPKQREDSNQ